MVSRPVSVLSKGKGRSKRMECLLGEDSCNPKNVLRVELLLRVYTQRKWQLVPREQTKQGGGVDGREGRVLGPHLGASWEHL